VAHPADDVTRAQGLIRGLVGGLPDEAKLEMVDPFQHAAAAAQIVGPVTAKLCVLAI
jgi:hypothetical protein